MSKRGHDVHVVKNSQGKGWVAKQDGEVVSRHRTQGAAQESGRREAKKDGVDLVTHGTDGKIRQKDSFGNDDYPPKG